MWYIRASWSLSIFPGFKNNRGARKHKVTCVAIPPCYLRHAEFFLIAGTPVLWQSLSLEDALETDRGFTTPSRDPLPSRVWRFHFPGPWPVVARCSCRSRGAMEKGLLRGRNKTEMKTSVWSKWYCIWRSRRCRIKGSFSRGKNSQRIVKGTVRENDLSCDLVLAFVNIVFSVAKLSRGNTSTGQLALLPNLEPKEAENRGSFFLSSMHFFKCKIPNYADYASQRLSSTDTCSKDRQFFFAFGDGCFTWSLSHPLQDPRFPPGQSQSASIMLVQNAVPVAVFTSTPQVRTPLVAVCKPRWRWFIPFSVHLFKYYHCSYRMHCILSNP